MPSGCQTRLCTTSTWHLALKRRCGTQTCTVTRPKSRLFVRPGNSRAGLRGRHFWPEGKRANAVRRTHTSRRLPATGAASHARPGRAQTLLAAHRLQSVRPCARCTKRQPLRICMRCQYRTNCLSSSTLANCNRACVNFACTSPGATCRPQWTRRNAHYKSSRTIGTRIQ